MAVGRLPRDQRNIGGTGRRPRTQRTSGATTTVQPQRRRLRSGAIQYPAVRWEATLREPVGVVPAGPRTFVVDVVGNTDLAGTPIEVGIDPRDPKKATVWQSAAWLSTDTNRGTCTAHIARPPAGRGTVVVRPHAAGQQPTLYAGRIVIQ